MQAKVDIDCVINIRVTSTLRIILRQTIAKSDAAVDLEYNVKVFLVPILGRLSEHQYVWYLSISTCPACLTTGCYTKNSLQRNAIFIEGKKKNLPKRTAKTDRVSFLLIYSKPEWECFSVCECVNTLDYYRQAFQEHVHCCKVILHVVLGMLWVIQPDVRVDVKYNDCKVPSLRVVLFLLFFSRWKASVPGGPGQAWRIIPWLTPGLPM